MNPQQRILIVEDDQFLREFYQELLQSEGYLIDIAPDGDIAWQKVHQGGYDLVMLDIMLPKKDGLQILKELKTSPAIIPSKVIVVLTNIGQDAIIKQCLELGASGYLIKSALNPDQVIQQIHSHLKPTP